MENILFFYFVERMFHRNIVWVEPHPGKRGCLKSMRQPLWFTFIAADSQICCYNPRTCGQFLFDPKY